MIKTINSTTHDVFAKHSDLLSALAHPTRLEIIQLLRGQSLNVTQMVQMLGLRQPVVSQHLMLMRDTGIVHSEKIGKEVYYRIAHANFTKAIDLMRDVLNIDLPEGGEPVVVDPVCHMQLTPQSAAHIYTYDGVRQYFCGRGCLNHFISEHKQD